MNTVYKKRGNKLLDGPEAYFFLRNSNINMQEKINKINYVKNYIEKNNHSYDDYSISDDFDLISKADKDMNDYEFIFRYDGLYLRCFKIDSLYMFGYAPIKIYGDPFEIYLGSYDNDGEKTVFTLQKNWSEGCTFNPILLDKIKKELEEGGDSFLAKESENFHEFIK